MEALLWHGWSIDPNGCWIWEGPTNQGYGEIAVNGVNKRAHRISYMHHVGDLSDDLHILHSCDTPLCVNPAHLRPGTDADNVADKMSRGRYFSGVPKTGSESHSAKMTDQQRSEIVALYATGMYKQREIAEIYGMSQPGISVIIRKFRA